MWGGVDVRSWWVWRSRRRDLRAGYSSSLGRAVWTCGCRSGRRFCPGEQAWGWPREPWVSGFCFRSYLAFTAELWIFLIKSKMKAVALSGAARWVSGLPRAEWGQSSVGSLFRFRTRLKPWDVVIFYFDPKGKWEGKLAAGNSVSLALFCVFLGRTGPSLPLLWPPAFLSLCPRHLPSRGESWRWAFSFLFFCWCFIVWLFCLLFWEPSWKPSNILLWVAVEVTSCLDSVGSWDTWVSSRPCHLYLGLKDTS